MTYNLEEGQVPETNMPVRFYIKPNRADGSASILVAENLDYETTRFFTLRVRVQNVAAVPLASFTTVYVNVTGEMAGRTHIHSQTDRSSQESPGSILFFLLVLELFTFLQIQYGSLTIWSQRSQLNPSCNERQFWKTTMKWSNEV